ncbi:MAG: inositol monophosphatase family protein [Candidatus Alcyoniella australis]|nr:inositol monophosphatase family protein [Candidatus Alcyoniella australis]
MDYREALEFTKQIAQQAGDYLLGKLDTELIVNSKSSPVDLVTDADRGSEELICSAIALHYPQHEIISEETARNIEGREYQWVVDPLDGTVNYAHGLRAFCVSIALLENGEPLLGVVHHPAQSETFWALRGQGAYVNSQRISVSPEPRLDRSLLATGFPYDIRNTAQTNLDHFLKFSICSQAVRRIGSAALDLAWVAAGRFEGFWELKLKIWDMAAGVLLVSEAGGQVSDFGGDKLNLFEPFIVASNGLIHEQMIKLLAQAPPDDLLSYISGNR